MALVPPFFLDCVVAVGFPATDGKIAYQATGFLWGRPVGKDAKGADLYRVYLLTNRHVFERETAAVLRFNPAADGPSKVYDIQLKAADGTVLWTPHPQKDADVAVTPINVGLLKQDGIQFAFFHEQTHALTRAKAKELGVSEGDGVFVLGFPLGLVGGDRNYVIVRSGVIARIRDSLAGVASDILIDASVFPGNSGGPVVTRPEITAIKGTKNLSTALLIGMVSSYLPYEDVAVSKQTGRPRVIFQENSGLAAVVPIDQLAEAVTVAEAKLPPLPPAPPQDAAGS